MVYLRGDFGIYDKPFPYERAVYVPMGIRYQSIFEPGQEYNQIVANIDISATIYNLAHVTPPDDIDGQSLYRLKDSGLSTEEIREGIRLSP
jgi:arylsulfatase A-like enzyme